MLCDILIIVNFSLFVQLSYAENPLEFRINVTNAQYGAREFNVHDIFMPIVAQNQPLDIIFMNYHGVVDGVSCQRKSEDYSFLTNFMNALIENLPCLIIKVKSITKDMSTQWECKVSSKDEGRARLQTITFKIHVKGAKPLDMTINDKPFIHESTSLSVTDHDGIGTYRFEPGEAIDLHCREPDGNARLELRYESAGETKVIQSQGISSKNPVFFSTILMANNDNDIVDCSYISKDKMKYTYRTVFQRKFQTSPDSPYEISVNNMKLVPTDKSEDSYQYKYYDDEEIEVTCEKQEIYASDTLIFGQEDNPLISSREVKVIEDTPSKRRIKCKAKHFQRKHLQCSTNLAKSKKANILFIPGTKEPHISGLPPSDLKYQYSDSDTTWFAHYWYSPNQIINLTCTTKYNDAELIIYINNTKMNQAEKVKYINHQIYLNNKYDGKSIVCTSHKGQNSIQRGIITLHENPKSPDYHHDDDGQINLLIIGVSVIGVLLTLVVICVICWCRVKRQKIPYKNETKELQIPKTDCTRQENYPENFNNSDFMVENSLYNGVLYAIPKKKEKVTEYHYIEVDDEIIKKKEELIKENISKQRAKENSVNIRNEVIENVDCIQPYYYAISSQAEVLVVYNKNADIIDYVEPDYCEINRR